MQFLYVLLGLCTLWLGGWRLAFFIGGVSSILTVLGLLCSSPGAPIGWSVFNRSIGLLTLWGMLWAGKVFIDRSLQLENSRASLQREIEHRTRTEQALRFREEQLRLALASSGAVPWSWDVPLNRLDEWTHEYRDLYGFSEDQPPTADTWFAHLHPEDRDRLKDRVQHMLETPGDDFWNEEFRILHPARGERWLGGMGQCYRDAEGRALRISGVNLDITERKLAEQALQTRNEDLESKIAHRTAQLQTALDRWELVTQATHDGIYDWDLTTHRVFYSPRWKEMHGLSQDEEQESLEQWSDRLHPDDRTRVLGHLNEYLSRNRQEFWEEYRIRRRDGSLMWVLDRGLALWDEEGRAVRMVGSEKDITWRKEAEESLRARERTFHALADNVPAFFAYIDASLRYTFVNKQYESLFGRPAADIIGYTVPELWGLETYAEIETYLAAALSGHEASCEFRHGTSAKRERWLSARYMSDRTENGVVLGVYALLLDVTDQKHTTTLLEKQRRRLQELSAKLLAAQEEERRRIARELHDSFTQRLAAIAVDLGSLERSSLSNATLLPHVRSMREAASQLADDVHDFAYRLHPSLLEHLGLEAAIRDQIDDVSRRTGLAIHYVQRGLAREIPIAVATCLYRVTQECLQNVLKHALASNVRIRLIGTVNGIGICIHDDGKGFSEEPPEVPSHGLGLISMEERVRLLKGTFRIRTQPGEGTEVHAWVPLTETSS